MLRKHHCCSRHSHSCYFQHGIVKLKRPLTNSTASRRNGRHYLGREGCIATTETLTTCSCLHDLAIYLLQLEHNKLQEQYQSRSCQFFFKVPKLYCICPAEKQVWEALRTMLTKSLLQPIARFSSNYDTKYMYYIQQVHK